MNIANKLTVLRIILVPFFVAFMLLDGTMFTYFNTYIALGIFIVACITDFLDGYLARKLNIVTDLGKLLDSTADKMLVCSALIIQAYLAYVILLTCDITNLIFAVLLVVFAIVIICRELFVSVFRALAASKGIIMAADMAGKVKAFVQMIALIILIPVTDLYKINTLLAQVVFYIGFALLAVGTVLAIISCINYIVKNKEVLKEIPSHSEKEICEQPSQVLNDSNWESMVMRMFISSGRASISSLQTHFSLGFTKAEKMMQTLCKNGWISEVGSNCERIINMTAMEFEEVFGEKL